MAKLQNRNEWAQLAQQNWAVTPKESLWRAMNENWVVNIDPTWASWTLTQNNQISNAVSAKSNLIHTWNLWNGNTTTTTGSTFNYFNTINYINTTAYATLYNNVWDAWVHNQRIDAETVVAIPGQVIQDATWDTWVEAETIKDEERQAERNRRQAAREAYNQEQQEAARQRALKEAEKIAAAARAKALLFEFLNEVQQRSWEEHKLFDKEIRGQVYRFAYGTHGNVARLEDDHIVERFCIAPVAPHDGGYLPVEDVVVAQMVLLECDETSFRKIANVSQYPRRPVVAAVPPPEPEPIREEIAA